MANIDVSQFAGTIDAIEYQKSYLFRIILPHIYVKTMGTLTPGEGFQLCTASTAFPIMSSATQNIAYYNSEIKVQTKTTFQDWSATFRLNLSQTGGSPVATGQLVDFSKWTALPDIPSFLKTVGNQTGLGVLEKFRNTIEDQTGLGVLEKFRNTMKPTVPISTFRYFYEWQLIAYNSSARVSNLPASYKQPISLILLNELGEEQKDVSFTLEGAFPVRISGGNLDYSNDSILTYNVDFAFDRFYIGLTAPPEI